MGKKERPKRESRREGEREKQRGGGFHSSPINSLSGLFGVGLRAGSYAGSMSGPPASVKLPLLKK